MRAIQLRHTHGYPGKYQAATNPVLAAALETLHGHGLFDMDLGDVDEQGGHSALIARWILRTDQLGFVTYDEYETVKEASDAFMDEMNGVFT